MSRVPHRYYREFQIKKGKKRRKIQAPRVALKVIQRWIGFHIARSIDLPECVFGFVPGKGVLDAARVHCASEWIYSLDLRDFFPNISAQRVCDALSQIGYSAQAAQLVTRLCTLNGWLPQGSPASPTLSNLVFLPTDMALQGLASSEGIRYSRYADDLVFSGRGSPPDELQRRVRGVLAENRWQIADEKEHLAKLPARLKVHGLVVHGTRPRLTKGYRNRIRAYRHLVAGGKIRAADAPSILGHLAYAAHVDEQERRSARRKPMPPTRS